MDQRSKSKGGTNRHVIPTCSFFFGNFGGGNFLEFLFGLFFGGVEETFGVVKEVACFLFFVFLKTGSFVFKRKQALKHQTRWQM